MIFDMAVLHYTLSDDVPAYIVDEWHEARGFVPRGTNELKHIGYHYLVRAFGMVEEGRSLDAQPTHCPGYNREGVLAICFCGSTPDETPWYPTEHQLRAGAGLLTAHNIPKDKIFGHGQLYDTSCPGRLDIPRIISLMGAAPSQEEEEDHVIDFVKQEEREEGQGDFADEIVDVFQAYGKGSDYLHLRVNVGEERPIMAWFVRGDRTGVGPVVLKSAGHAGTVRPVSDVFGVKETDYGWVTLHLLPQDTGAFRGFVRA